ncbi:MAG: Tetratricopeptide repeat protein [candidate division NC10 bacterium]|nr:Tetratricopeptide repeat protein [candidate division NC10 bacterium]
MAFDKRKALQNALAYTQQGRWDRAIVEYQSILKADPRDVTVCNNLGDLFARAGKTADAIDQYLKLGELYRADGLSVKAIAVYKKIAKLDPARTEAYLACADLYWEQGLVGEAKIQMATVVEHFSRSGEKEKLIDAYKRLSQFDPTNAAVLVRLADLMLREGLREAAAGEYERAAQAAQAAGQAAEAKRLLQKARDLSPGVREPKETLAERLLGEGKLPEAIDVLKEITSAEPENAKAWRALGEAQASQKGAREAISSLQRAVTLGVPEGEIARPLGLALLQAGQAEDAVALCQRVTEAGLASGDPDAAIAFCRELAATAPQLVALHAHLAAMLQNLGRMEEARVALRSLATAQESAGQPESAVATYHRLVEMDPSDAEARARLEALEPPAPTPEPEAPPPSPSRDDTAELPADSPKGPTVDASDLSLSSLEALGLSLGAEDAALLLEEPESAVSSGAPDVTPPASESSPGGMEEASDEGSQTTAWLTQELQSIDLEEAAAGGQGAGAAWASGGPALELEDISANFGGSGLAPLETDSALQEEGSAGVPEGDSSLLDVPVVELAEGSEGSAASLLDLPTSVEEAGAADRPEEDAQSSQVAEQLAEADVYQKYGLEEKARERLLEVVHIAPDNLTARRRLKAIYRDRRQTEEACAEMLAIARILRERHQEEAAVAEIREGLSLAPARPDLLRFLVGVAPVEEPAGGVSPSEFPSGVVQARDDVAASAASESVPVVPTEAAGDGAGGAPPPDVPLLLELDEAALGAEPTAASGPVPAPADSQTLPTELQALLDGNEAELDAAAAEPGAERDRAMADDVAEAEFYLSQGMVEEARAVHRRVQARDPEHPAVGALAEQIERAAPAAPIAEAPEPAALPELPPIDQPAGAQAVSTEVSGATAQEMSPQFSVTSESPNDAPAGFVNLGAELDQELDGGEQTAAAPPAGPVVDGLLRELQKGVREQLDEKDYETHYNLGIAYKEMELYDEAIQEFRLTAHEPKRALECADLVGLCYLAKGQPEQAIQDLQTGLAIEGHPPDAYHALRYDLGTAFEAVGDLPRALEQLEILQVEGARFLDVQTRLEALRARLPKPPVPTTDGEKPRRKKKISFI